MSGPPPCTTTGLIPTYLSSTTSRANSSRSNGSSIAAPPYLIYTVAPHKSRRYGSASRRVATSRISIELVRREPLGRVLRVDLHVVVAEIGEEQLGLGALPREVDLVEDLVAADGACERVCVERDASAGAADRDALDRDLEQIGRAHV